MSVLLKIPCLVCLNLCSGFVEFSLKCSTAFFSLVIIQCAVVSAKTSSLILGLAFSLFQGSLWALYWDLSVWMLSLQSWLHKCVLAVLLGIECTWKLATSNAGVKEMRKKTQNIFFSPGKTFKTWTGSGRTCSSQLGLSWERWNPREYWHFSVNPSTGLSFAWNLLEIVLPVEIQWSFGAAVGCELLDAVALHEVF